MRRALIAALCSLLVFAGSAFAISLDQAKREGLVGETPSGYLAAVGNPSPEVQQLISDINAQRRAKYAQIAQKNRTAIGAVEALAGKKAMDETAPGNFIQRPSGEWVRK